MRRLKSHESSSIVLHEKSYGHDDLEIAQHRFLLHCSDRFGRQLSLISPRLGFINAGFRATGWDGKKDKRSNCRELFGCVTASTPKGRAEIDDQCQNIYHFFT